MRVKNWHIVALAMAILAMSTMVRLNPLMDYSPQPTTYSAGAIYCQKLVIDSGHFPSQTEAEDLVSEHPFSGSLIEYSTYPVFPSFLISSMIVVDVEPGSWGARILLSLCLALPIVTIALCFFSKRLGKSRMSKRERVDTAFLVCAAIVLLYSQMGSPFLINQLGSQGWIFFLYPIYLLFVRKEDEFRTRAVSLLFLCLLPMVYFTAASFFLLWLSIITVKRYVTEKSTNGLARILVVVFIVYLSYNLVMSTGRGMSLMHVSANLLDFVRGGFSGFSSSSLSLPQEYLVNTSLLNKARYAVNAILVVLPVLLLLVYRKRVRNFSMRFDEVVVAGILTLPVFLLILYFWIGSLSIGRIPEYGSLMSLLAVLLLVTVNHGKVKILIAIIASLAIIASCVTYISDENTPYRLLTEQEDSAGSWILEVIPEDNVVFTDHRLAGALVGEGFLTTTGLVEKISVHYTTERIEVVYYDYDGRAAFDIISIEYNSSYVFFSLGMANESPAIFLYNYPIHHAPENFMEKYENSSFFNKVFDNGEGITFAL